ncbi:MAG TPA: tetratricopeptide repeat protein [Pyrinomonadaceae bacterium]|nr:tetratricopeptide repeat protein [Pyrinomonadaceae bacterium]
MNFPHLLILLLLFLTPSTAIRGQERSHAELLKEAGRLATEAERKGGEAYKQVQAGADRKLIRDAEKFAAENFEKAIELWREVGDVKRLIAGVDELTRLYSVIGEYDKVVDRLTREAEFWRGLGRVAEQVDTLYTLGIRQSQMKRDAAAIETYERVLAMSRSARLRSLEPNVLTQLAFSYERVGRLKDAEAARATAKKLWDVPDREPVPRWATDPVPPATIPAQWVDLPGAPAAAEYRVIEGVNEAVLVNRSTKVIRAVMFGCVALEDNGKVRELYGLGGEAQSHGGVAPGRFHRPFLRLNGPLNRWTDEKMGCEGAAKMTLIEAQFDDGSKWKADGIDWAK